MANGPHCMLARTAGLAALLQQHALAKRRLAALPHKRRRSRKFELRWVELPFGGRALARRRANGRPHQAWRLKE
jgi:hypothetical protein